LFNLKGEKAEGMMKPQGKRRKPMRPR